MRKPAGNWENVCSPTTGDYLERIHVPGGWLYRQTYIDHRLSARDHLELGLICTALEFVPDGAAG